MDKSEIRNCVRARKSLLDPEERSEAARAVFAMLEKTAAYMMSTNILLYHSLPDELPTTDFLAGSHADKRFFLPRVNGVNLEILPYDRSRMHLGAFNIEEPDGTDVQDISDIDMVIVPAVAYDRRGNRIGRGKGFYDRLLRDTRAIKVGVIFDCQLIDDFEAENHDVAVDYVITERGIIRTSRKI